jgi:hypothetical protein
VGSRLRIFISAGPDLETEREVVGKAIASLPVSLGWVIKYTPIHGELSDSAFEAVRSCDFYALLLGRDIAAPVGSELRVARQTGKRIAAFLKEVPRTPAAQVFVRQSLARWRQFGNEEALRSLLQKAVVDQILGQADLYRITVADWEALSTLSARLAEEVPEENEEITPGHGGAGSDAVIISPQRDLPSEGVPIERRRDSSRGLDHCSEASAQLDQPAHTRSCT